MFIAHYENTMRNAKFKTVPKAFPVNNNVEMHPTLAEFTRLVQRVAALELAAARAQTTIVAPLRRTIDYATIARRLCRVFRVKRDELLSTRRDRRVMLARQAIMYWSCRLTTMSLPALARLMHRDHTTVLHGKKVYVEKRARMGRHLRSLSPQAAGDSQ